MTPTSDDVGRTGGRRCPTSGMPEDAVFHAKVVGSGCSGVVLDRRVTFRVAGGC